MEVKEKSKKREIIKTVAIVFLVVLLLLTFFSNTIMNRSLPEVATQSISSGTINARIRGSGTVSPNESYEVIINQTREVRSVCVQVGDTVSQGDLLFILGDMESAELQSAQEQLDALNLQYQQQLLTLSREYAGEDRAIQVLREDLEKAVRQRDDNLVTGEEISSAKGGLEEAKNQLSQLERSLEELNAMLGDDEMLTQAKAEVDRLTAQITALQDDIAEYSSQLAQLSATGSAEMLGKIQQAETAVAAAKTTLSSHWLAYESTYLSLVSGVKEWYKDSMDSSIFAVTEDSDGLFVITSQQQMYIDAYLAEYASSGTNHPHEAAYQALLADYNNLQARNAELAQLRMDSSTAQNDVNNQRATIQAKLNQASYERAAAAQQLQYASSALAQAENNSAALKNQIKGYEESQRQQTALVESLTQELTALEAKKVLYDQAVELVAEKERAIEDALTGKDIDRQLDDLDIQSLRSQIEKAQELVDKYTAQSVDTEIKANVSGLVSAINVSAGKETTAGAAMAVIDVVDQGYIIQIPVTNEQSRQVRVGDTASVTNYYWGNNVEAMLEAIIADPANPGRGKLLVFRVTGDVDAGANITLSIGQRSANYDAIIPKSALREDTNGYFVLVITVKSSPLSNRYIATRVDVQVLAEDDTSAAVSGLSAGDFVITTSSKPVEPGAQVRMVENP